VFDVCCVGNAVVLITRGSAGEPGLESRVLGKLDAVSGVHERIFAPKSKFEPLKLVGAGSTVVAASSDPRVAVCRVANDGTLTSSAAPGASFDTSSIVNHDVAMSPDGNGRFAVATFSADVPIFSVDERAKLRKVSSCVGAKKKVKCVAWSGCGRYIVASSEDRMLRVFDVRADKARYEAVVSSGVPATATLDSLAWVGDRVVGASGTDIFVFDGKSLDVLDVVRGAHNASPIRLAADHHHQGNSKFVCSWSSNSARLWKVGL
jgi:WD40 repeat protein